MTFRRFVYVLALAAALIAGAEMYMAGQMWAGRVILFLVLCEIVGQISRERHL